MHGRTLPALDRIGQHPFFCLLLPKRSSCLHADREGGTCPRPYLRLSVVPRRFGKVWICFTGNDASCYLVAEESGRLDYRSRSARRRTSDSTMGFGKSSWSRYPSPSECL